MRYLVFMGLFVVFACGDSSQCKAEFRERSPDGTLDAVLSHHESGGYPKVSRFRLSICEAGSSIADSLDSYLFDSMLVGDEDNCITWIDRSTVLVRYERAPSARRRRKLEV